MSANNKQDYQYNPRARELFLRDYRERAIIERDAWRENHNAALADWGGAGLSSQFQAGPIPAGCANY